MDAAMRCFISVLLMLVAITMQNIGFAFGKDLREIHQVRPGVWAFKQSEPIVQRVYLIGNMDVGDLMFTLWSLQLAIHYIAMTVTLFELLLVIRSWFYKQYSWLKGNDQDEEGDWEDVEDDEDCGICPKNRITTFEKKDKRSGFGRTKKPRLKSCTAPGCVDLTPETCGEFLPLHSTQLPCKNAVEKEVDPEPEKTSFYKCLLGSEGSFGEYLTSDEDVNNDIKNNDEVVDDYVKEPLVHNGDVDNEVKSNNNDIVDDSVKDQLFDNGDVDNEVKSNNNDIVDDCVKEPVVDNGDVDNEVKSNHNDKVDACVKDQLVDNDVKNIDFDIVDDCVKEKLFDKEDVDNGDVDIEVKNKDDEVVDHSVKKQLIVENNQSCEEMFRKCKTHLEPLKSHFMKDPKPRRRLHRMRQQQPHFNRLTFKPNKAEFYSSGFGHILEIHDFSPEMTTGDFKEAFSSFRKSGFDIRWVDGWHVLVIFSSANAANEALVLPQAKLRIRPLSLGSKQSQHEFQINKQFLQPVKPQLPRDTFVAYRLILGALGLLRNSVSRQQYEADMQQKKKEREKYRIARYIEA